MRINVLVLALLFTVISATRLDAQPPAQNMQTQALDVSGFDITDIAAKLALVEARVWPKQFNTQFPLVFLKLQARDTVDLTGKKLQAGFFSKDKELLETRSTQLNGFKLLKGESLWMRFDGINGFCEKIAIREVKADK
jgi:hypothetical protein